MTEQKPDGPQLREAQAEDAALLVSILHAAFAEYRERLDPPSGVLSETVDTVRQKLETGHAVIAFLGAEAVGCVFYWLEDTQIYLGRLAVLPEFRKRGVSRALIGYIEQQARLRGIPKVQLGTRLVLTRLREYYARLGYYEVRFATHEGYTEPTYVMMEKEVLP